jgi:hypothetical protein
MSNINNQTNNKELSLTTIVKKIDLAQKQIEKKEEMISKINKEIENKREDIAEFYKLLQDFAKEGIKLTKK